MRHERDLHIPVADLTVYQIGAHYAGIRPYIKLPFKLNVYLLPVHTLK